VTQHTAFDRGDAEHALRIRRNATEAVRRSAHRQALMSPSLAPRHTNYLLFSDVHLGADLVQHARPWTVSRLRQVLRIDRELSAMLDHYRQHAEPGRPWQLIIAGDLVDFMGMSIAPRDDHPLETPLTEEERLHGLGSTRDHAALKMRAVAERHALVFEKLAQFVAEGHSLMLVRGNHDVDFYWETARAAFVEALVARAGDAVAEPEARAAFEQRVDFRHWFYYVEGLLYVEHGHQYDETCAYDNVLAPLSPRDPKRIAYSFSDILMRYVVHPTRGMGNSGHDGKTMVHYVQMAFAMGLHGALALGGRYWRAAMVMLRACREHLSEHGHAVRQEHERHLHELGERLRLSLDKLRALSALSARPVTLGFRAILRSLFLDLAAAMTGSTLLIALLLLTGAIPIGYVAPLAVALGSGIYVWMKSSRVIDQCAALRRGAARVAELFPARFVVMGHTHAPLMEPLAGGATYVNLGGWAEDDLDAPTEGQHEPNAPRTHLVIRHENGEPRAELRRWCSLNGPSVLLASDSPADSGIRLRPTDERAA
jgi:UDP-2,3-diacylglucosamine pyrophosphatase LpxH